MTIITVSPKVIRALLTIPPKAATIGRPGPQPSNLILNTLAYYIKKLQKRPSPLGSSGTSVQLGLLVFIFRMVFGVAISDIGRYNLGTAGVGAGGGVGCDMLGRLAALFLA